MTSVHFIYSAFVALALFLANTAIVEGQTLEQLEQELLDEIGAVVLPLLGDIGINATGLFAALHL